MHFYFAVSVTVMLVTKGRHTFECFSLITKKESTEVVAGKHLHRMTNNIGSAFKPSDNL